MFSCDNHWKFWTLSEPQSRTLTFEKSCFYLLQWKPFKNDEKCFLFHAKSFFRSKDIQIFALTFWLCRKTAWLISKFMTLRTGQQIITMHILSNISRSKGNQTIKFGQLIECSMNSIFLEKLHTKCGGEPSQKSLFLFYVKVEVYQNILNLIFYFLLNFC